MSSSRISSMLLFSFHDLCRSVLYFVLFNASKVFACLFVCLFVCLMIFNAIFNNISVILWQSVLLVEETTDLSQVTDKLYHIMVYSLHWSRFKLTTSVVLGTGCIGSCKSNYHTITATTAPPAKCTRSTKVCVHRVKELTNNTSSNIRLRLGIVIIIPRVKGEII